MDVKWFLTLQNLATIEVFPLDANSINGVIVALGVGGKMHPNLIIRIDNENGELVFSGGIWTENVPSTYPARGSLEKYTSKERFCI